MTNTSDTPGAAAAFGVAAPAAVPRAPISPDRLDVGRRALEEKTAALRAAEIRAQEARTAQTRQLRLWHLRGMSFDDLAKASGMTRQAVQKRLKASS